jgi:CHAD domain-containing protein
VGYDETVAESARTTDPLVRYVDRLMRRLRRRIPAALRDWDPKAIHEVRVSTRRLRAALDLLGPVVPAKRITPLRKTARRLRRRLGSLRDYDVMIERLKMLSRRPRLAGATKWMSDRLLDARNKARRKAKKKRSVAELLDRLDAWKPLREQIIQITGVVDALMIASLRSQWDAFADRAESRSSELFIGQGGQGDAVANPHELRIAGKMLRYTFEMLDEAGHALPPMVRRTFKQMQNALGDWHDCVVLAECAMRMSLDESLALVDPAMEAKVLELTRFILRRGDRALKRFAALWRENGAELAEVVDATASAPRTGHGPAGLTEPPEPADDQSGASSAA